MKTALRIIILLMAAATHAAAQPTDRERNTLYNSRWNSLPSKQLTDMGRHFRKDLCRNDSAFVCYSIVANRMHENNLSGEQLRLSIGALSNIGLLYLHHFHDFPTAYTYTMKALELARQHNFSTLLPGIYTNLATLKAYQAGTNCSDSATRSVLDIHKKAFYMAYRQRNWQCMKVNFFDMMIKCFNLNEDLYIKNEMNLVLRHVPDTVEWKPMAASLIKGVRACNAGKHEEALGHFRRFRQLAGRITSNNERPSATIIANNYIYVGYLNMRRADKAIGILHENVDIARRSNEILHLSDAYSNLAAIYRAEGDSARAARYRLLFLEEQNIIEKQKRLSELDNTEFLYRMQKKNDEVVEQAQRRKTQEKVMLVAFAFSMALLAVLALLYRKYRQLQAKNRLLYTNIQAMLRADEDRLKLIEMSGGGSAAKTDSGMTQEEMSDLLHRLFVVMETSPEIYTENFSVARMAELVGEREYKVSRAINERYATNFYAFLAEYRVKEACRRMNDTARYGHLTIESIAQGVGFKSRSNFITVFKRVTGLTPSAYLRMAKAGQEANHQA